MRDAGWDRRSLCRELIREPCRFRWGAGVDIALGAGFMELVASASSGLPVIFEVISGPADLNGTTMTVTDLGNVDVRASQPGNKNFNPAVPLERTIIVRTRRDQWTIQFFTEVEQNCGRFDSWLFGRIDWELQCP